MRPAPKFSVVIPARNEEKLIGRCLDSIRKAASSIDGSVQVIVVLNRCTDRTEDIARAAGCEIVREDAKNLAQIRNAGLRAATAQYLITIDADSEMSTNMFVEIHRALSNEQIVGGGVLIIPERWSLGIALTALYLLPIALWYGITAGLFFCRKSDFDAIGGFNEALHSVEDIDFARRLKAHGKRTGRRFANLMRCHIRTSCRKFDTFGDWYFVKNPRLVWKLLQGHHQAEANKIWYDYER